MRRAGEIAQMRVYGAFLHSRRVEYDEIAVMTPSRGAESSGACKPARSRDVVLPIAGLTSQVSRRAFGNAASMRRSTPSRLGVHKTTLGCAGAASVENRPRQ